MLPNDLWVSNAPRHDVCYVEQHLVLQRLLLLHEWCGSPVFVHLSLSLPLLHPT